MLFGSKGFTLLCSSSNVRFSANEVPLPKFPGSIVAILSSSLLFFKGANIILYGLLPLIISATFRSPLSNFLILSKSLIETFSLDTTLAFSKSLVNSTVLPLWPNALVFSGGLRTLSDSLEAYFEPGLKGGKAFKLTTGVIPEELFLGVLGVLGEGMDILVSVSLRFFLLIA